MTTIVDTTKNPVIIPTGTAKAPFTAVTVSDPIGTLETVSVTLSPYYYYSLPDTDLGTLTDPRGGGTFDAVSHTFIEAVSATGTPTGATEILNRLIYSPPTLSNGTSSTVGASVSVNGVADPSNPLLLWTVTPPAITGTIATQPVASTSTIRPFGAVQVQDGLFPYYSSSSYQYTPPNLATTITVTDGGAPTDADGLLTGMGLSKTGTGTYTVLASPQYSTQSYLHDLVFTPNAVSPGGTRTTAFEIGLKDSTTGLATNDKITSVLVVGPGSGAPLIAGTLGDQTVTAGQSITPFGGVTVSDVDPNSITGASLTLSGGGTLSGPGLTSTAPGSYTIAATSPAGLTAILNKAIFTPAGNDQSTTSIELDVTDGTQTSIDTKTTIKTVAPSPRPEATHFNVGNQTTGQQSMVTGDAYAGPVAGILRQYVNITADNLNVTATTPNSFIHTGSGTDAIDVSGVGGTNVLDGFTGSNFLVGGSGADTFFVDNRNAPAAIWSTVSGFNAGDAATVWGVTPKDFNLDWVDNQGATGYKGLTLNASAAGKPTASLTLVGYSQADLQNGRLSVNYGTDPAAGGGYMYIHGDR